MPVQEVGEGDGSGQERLSEILCKSFKWIDGRASYRSITRARSPARLQTYLACVPAGSAMIDGADTSVCCQPVICS